MYERANIKRCQNYRKTFINVGFSKKRDKKEATHFINILTEEARLFLFIQIKIYLDHY